MNYDSYTSYGAGGGAGGGGFMPGDGSQNSPSGGKNQREDSLRPVTIKQILDAQPTAGGEEFKIDGALISQVTFVGQIRNISTQHTNITYKLDDGTGTIEVKQWVEADSMGQTNPTREKFVEGAYCRAWGKPKSFYDQRYVGAQIIRPVDDYNEMSYHLLEATAVHLYFTRGPPGGATSAGNATVNGKQQQPTGDAYGGAELAHYTPVARKVFQHLREAPQSNEGLHQQDIAAALGIDTGEVARAGDDLLAGGLIYTTVDDQTWAVLEAD